MFKDPLKLLLGIAAGILIIILFVWFINTYVVAAIFSPRIESGNSTKVGDSSTQDKNALQNSTVDEQNVDTKAITAPETTPDLQTPENLKPGAEAGSPSQTPPKKEAPDSPQANTNRGNWDEQKGAYKI
jgi:hypothetical protein